MNWLDRGRGLRPGAAAAGLLILLLAVDRQQMAGAATPLLVRVADGSSDPPTDTGIIAFQNVGQPNGRQTFYAAQNPIIQGHNLYAVDLLRTQAGSTPIWNNYFGGWKTPGQVNDLIYLSRSTSLDINGPWSDPQVAISNGAYLHVNDPSVVIDEGVYHMVYTAARTVNHPRFGTFFRDWINYSSSPDGVVWTPNAGVAAAEVELTDPNQIGIGTITSIARPSLVKTDFGWKMWFDGRADNQPDSAFHSYLAHATTETPTVFELVHYYPDITNFPGFFEPDIVLRPDGTYLGVIQRHFDDLYQVTSNDGINFSLTGLFFDQDHPFYPRDHVSNPGLIYDQIDDVNYGVGFGMANMGLTDHDIGFALAQYIVEVRSPPTSPGGAPVWHMLARSNGMNEQQLSVFQFNQFDLVRITDSTSGAIVLEQAFSDAHAGDVWELRFAPDLPGDYDQSGAVDAADYTLWRDTLGQAVTPFAAADGDGNGSIEVGDYVVWKTNFGATRDDGSAGAQVVPEPAALYLLALGTAGLVRYSFLATASWCLRWREAGE